MKEDTARWWFRRFKQGDTSLEDQPRSGRAFVVNKEELRVVVEQQPSSSTRRLSGDLGPSRRTIARHLHNLGFVCRNPLRVPHDLTENQAQRRLDLCQELLTNPRDKRFWRRIVTGD